MNVVISVVTIGALVVAVIAWRSGWALLRRLLTVGLLLVGAYMIAWVGAGTGHLPHFWVTDHPIAMIGAWSFAVLAVVGPLTLSRYRIAGRARSMRQA